MQKVHSIAPSLVGREPPPPVAASPSPAPRPDALDRFESSEGPAEGGLGLPQLPPDMFREVLRRVSPRSLIEVRRVARAWNRESQDLLPEVSGLAFLGPRAREVLRALPLDPTALLREAARASIPERLSRPVLEGLLRALSTHGFALGERAVGELVEKLVAVHPEAREALWSAVRAEWEPACGPILARAGVEAETLEAVRQLREKLMACGSFDEARARWGAETVFGRSLLPPRTLATTPARWCSVEVLEGHTDYIIDATVLPDGRLVTVSGDKTARVWREGAEGWASTALEGHTHKLAGVTVLPDARLVTASWDGTARVWGERAGEWSSTVLKGDRSTGTASATALLDGRFITVCGRVARVWRERAGEWSSTPVEGHGQFIARVVPFPDGRFATASLDRTLRVWREREGQWVATVLGGHQDHVCDAALLPDRRLISVSWDGTARVWREHDDQWIAAVLPVRMPGLRRVTLLPDGRFLTLFGSQARVWREHDSAWSSTLIEGHTHHLAHVAVLPDGHLVSASYDRTARVWREGEGSWTSFALEGHTDILSHATALPDGRVATVSHDRTVRVWGPPRVEL